MGRTRVLVQGLGAEGQNQIRRSLAYGTTVVAGVHPSFRGGSTFENFTVFNTVEEAVAKQQPNCAIIFVPAPGAADCHPGKYRVGNPLDRLHHRRDPGSRHGACQGGAGRKQEPLDRP